MSPAFYGHLLLTELVTSQNRVYFIPITDQPAKHALELFANIYMYHQMDQLWHKKNRLFLGFRTKNTLEVMYMQVQF